MATDMITVSALLDKEVLDRITELQRKSGIFSRAKILREIIERGLIEAEQEFKEVKMTKQELLDELLGVTQNTKNKSTLYIIEKTIEFLEESK